MKRAAICVALTLVCAASLRADVTLTQTVTIAGGMAAMAGGMMPKMTTRIKGLKSRMEVEVMDQRIVTLTDLAARQVILLNSATKTAQVLGAGGTQVPGVPPAMPQVDMSFKPTGQSRVIEGAKCEEHAFDLAVSMSEMAASGQAPPEAAAMMQDVKMVMSGSVWIAPGGAGVADYTRFQKAAAESSLLGALTGMLPGQGSGAGGMDKLMAAAASAPGLPYLTEMTMTFQGTGPMVEMMKKMGPMTMSQRITAVSTDPIPDSVFEVPEGYQIVKK